MGSGVLGLARYFRFLVKKRHNRQSGSQRIAALGQSLMFSLLFAGGVLFLIAVLTTRVVPEWRVNNSYRQATCTVVETRLAVDPEDDTRYRPSINIRYQVDGQEYGTWTYDFRTLEGEGYSDDREAQEAIRQRYVAGEQYPCWYDPDDPRQAVIERGFNWLTWVLLLLPIAFIAIGGSGAGYVALTWGKSAERRAMIAQRARHFDLTEAKEETEQELFPAVPESADLTNSPGVRLKYRLPLERSPAWQMIVAILVCVALMGAAFMFMQMAVRTHQANDPDWLLTLFAASWLIAGLAATFYALRPLFTATRVGQTIVEISNHPLYPGRSYKVFVGQSGRLVAKDLALCLVCEEIATYRQGTNTRTARKRVYQEELVAEQDITIRQNQPFEREASFEVPTTAMHSFKTPHNEVHWQLVVSAEIDGLEALKRQFPLVVYPCRPPEQDE